MRNSLALVHARRHLNLWSCKKRDVFNAICNELKCTVPLTKAAQWAVLQRYVKALGPQPRSTKALQRARRAKEQRARIESDLFLATYEWRRLRMEVLVERGARCECCGSTPKDGAQMNVDHVKPRKLFPELRLDKSNLQVLCHVCNHGKGNWDQTDWRQS